MCETDEITTALTAFFVVAVVVGAVGVVWGYEVWLICCGREGAGGKAGGGEVLVCLFVCLFGGSGLEDCR